MVAYRIVTVAVCLLIAVTPLAWATGHASDQAIAMLAIGFALVAAFGFVLSLIMRFPFQRLRAALASLLAIVLVMLGVLYATPLIGDYRQGLDVGGTLLHPLVFVMLGLAVVLLTTRQ